MNTALLAMVLGFAAPSTPVAQPESAGYRIEVDMPGSKVVLMLDGKEIEAGKTYILTGYRPDTLKVTVIIDGDAQEMTIDLEPGLVVVYRIARPMPPMPKYWC